MSGKHRIIKKHQKIYYFCLTIITTVYAGLICLLPGYIFALEVQYPAMSNTPAITDSTSLPIYVKYLFEFGMSVGLFAVMISLVMAGVMYLMSPAKPGLLGEAKDRVGGAISGLLILIFTYLIVTTLNPQLNVFNIESLTPVTPPPSQINSSPGVHFYKQTGCPSESRDSKNSSSSIPDLGKLKNGVNSINIVQDGLSEIYYISILYDAINFVGKCQYIDPNNGCQNVSPFAASASIHKYDDSPNGDGVYLYRKSYFNEEGGWLKISNSQIQNAGSDNLYSADLNQLRFTGSSSSNNCNVPEDEQDCIKYDDNGTCCTDETCDSSGRRCPTLGGENISSIKINGSYLVLLAYVAPMDNQGGGPWTYCQEFPTVDDVNKTGPQQIKWQHIRNLSGMTPNYILIIPIGK